MQIRDRRPRIAASCAALSLVLTICGATAASAAPEDGSAAAPEAPKPACEQPPAATSTISDLPWQIESYDAPERIWPYSTGAGVTVGVVATGVDAAHPQLAGKVAQGFDFVRGVPEGNVDCAAQGTAVASVIVARRTPNVGFYGLAPDAMIVPARVGEQAQLVPPSGEKFISPDALAAGIDYVVSSGANVVVVPDVVFYDAPVLQASVANAIAGGAVVVAAVGDAHPQQEPDADRPSPSSLTPYPASYPGVIGAASVAPDGQRAATSQIGEYVDVVAPGENVIAAGVVGQDQYKSSGVASGYAAAAAALVLGAKKSPIAGVEPSQRSYAVEARLRSTASPVSGYLGEQAYGGGLVDPYRALTEGLSGLEPQAVPPYADPSPDPHAERVARMERDAATNASIIGWSALGVLAAASALIYLVRRGRRTGLRPMSTADRPDRDRDRDLEYVAGDKLFAPPPEP